MEPAESAWPKKNAEKESSEWFLNNAIGVKTKKGVSRPNTKSLSDETKSVLYDISDYETWQKNEWSTWKRVWKKRANLEKQVITKQQNREETDEDSEIDGRRHGCLPSSWGRHRPTRWSRCTGKFLEWRSRLLQTFDISLYLTLSYVALLGATLNTQNNKWPVTPIVTFEDAATVSIFFFMNCRYDTAI